MEKMELEEIVSSFHKNGFVVLDDLLSKEECNRLINDARPELKGRTFKSKDVRVSHRMFEVSDNFFELLFNEKVVEIAKFIINDNIVQKIAADDYKIDFTGHDAATSCHVIHNSAIVVESNTSGISKWHQDDPPHYIIKNGVIPENVHLPCLFFTTNYYLTDVTDISNGPMSIIPGSHLFGKPCPPSIDESKYDVYNFIAKAGSAILFNNQTWHRGSPNSSDTTRFVAQVTYGRRIIGHKYFPFMNYRLPDHIYEKVKNDPLRKSLIGFLKHGPYG